MEIYTNPSMNRIHGNVSRSYAGRNMSDRNRSQSAAFQDTCNNDFPIGMAYVPWQSWKNIYEPDKALQKGTIFEELYKPFLGMQGVKR